MPCDLAKSVQITKGTRINPSDLFRTRGPVPVQNIGLAVIHTISFVQCVLCHSREEKKNTSQSIGKYQK